MIFRGKGRVEPRVYTVFSSSPLAACGSLRAARYTNSQIFTVFLPSILDVQVPAVSPYRFRVMDDRSTPCKSFGTEGRSLDAQLYAVLLFFRRGL